MVNTWKILAITFFILLTLETALFIWSYNIGVEDYEGELKCSSEICFNNNQSYYYTYDTISDICSCYGYDDTVIYQQFLG